MTGSPDTDYYRVFLFVFFFLPSFFWVAWKKLTTVDFSGGLMDHDVVD